MDVVLLLFLSSGLFLGWSLGASDASNIFGTAVATKMVRFKTAAIISSVFIILKLHIYPNHSGNLFLRCCMNLQS